MTDQALLRTENVSKSYDGVHALRQVSFDLRRGEIHALVGENGAGKSTLIKIITGAITPNAGTIELDGQIVANNNPGLAKSLGIAAIYQQPALFPELTVVENIALGSESRHWWQPIRWKDRRRRVTALLEKTGAKIDPDGDAGNLTMPEQQLVEIARALGANARVLILDEPTAALSENESRHLMRLLSELRDQGVGIVYISHRLEELTAIADRVTILRDGAVVGTRQVSETNQQELIQLMVGRELSAVFPKREVEFGEVVLELRSLGCSSSGLTNIDLNVRAGEILGLAGLVGAGRTELAKTIFGLEPADTGEIRLRGRAVKIGSPGQAIESGIAYLPEDRRQHGVILDMSIKANITLASLKRMKRRGAFDADRETRIAADYARRFAIKTPAIFNPVSTLSGGNQQKVALSRWLATNPSVLILDEPTQGIDVGAKAEIHTLMGELAAQGMAIVMISSELPEILGMSDRIAVMRSGTIGGVLDRAEATQEGILAMALGL